MQSKLATKAVVSMDKKESKKGEDVVSNLILTPCQSHGHLRTTGEDEDSRRCRGR